MPTIWEPYAGSAGVARTAMGWPKLVAFMGAKDKLAPAILDAVGWRGLRPTKIVLNDPGHWGWVWHHLRHEARRVAAIVLSWTAEDRVRLWDRLVRARLGASGDCFSTAQFLYLQARSVRGLPLYFSGERWVQHRANGTTKEASQRQPPRQDGSGGGLTAHGLARRVAALGGAVAGAVTESWIGRAEGLDLCCFPQDFVYLDPPYAGATPYEHTETRANVVAIACAAADRGAAVAVSEREPIGDLVRLGWSALDLTVQGHGFPEWLTYLRADPK